MSGLGMFAWYPLGWQLFPSLIEFGTPAQTVIYHHSGIYGHLMAPFSLPLVQESLRLTSPCSAASFFSSCKTCSFHFTHTRHLNTAKYFSGVRKSPLTGNEWNSVMLCFFMVKIQAMSEKNPQPPQQTEPAGSLSNLCHGGQWWIGRKTRE